MSALAPIIEIPPEGYARGFESQVDNFSDREIFVRGRLYDHLYEIEHTWVLRTPEYEVVEATAKHIRGESKILSPEIPPQYPMIRGVRIGRGFTQGVRSIIGESSGVREHLFLAIEMARVGQQVYKFPENFEKQFLPVLQDLRPGASHDARLAWEKDRAYMPNLVNSCYTYRDGSAELFAQRTISCTFGGSVTSPSPGEPNVFWRRKRLSIARTGEANDDFLCKNSMEDTIHDIRVEFHMTGDGSILEAGSKGVRLPYTGLCEDAQTRTSGLEGKQVDRNFVRLLADHVGGASGCTHLFDLSVDCLRLFDFSV